MRKIAVVITLATVGILLSSGADAANVLLNPGFTDNGTYGDFPTTNITHWTTWGLCGRYQDDINNNASVKFWYDDSSAYQDFNANAGVVYKYSIYAQTLSSDQLKGWKGYLKAEWFDSGYTPISSYVVDYFTTNDNVDQWVQLSGLATAPVGTVHGRFTIGIEYDQGGTAGSLYFDNASVEAIPEPSAVALLALGAVGILTARQRRRR